MALVGPTALGITMGTQQMAGCLMRQSCAYLYYDKDHLELPSYVAFTDTDVLLGREAYDQIQDNPENTLYDMKRLIGRFYNDPDIYIYLQEWPFKVVNVRNRPKYLVNFKGSPTTFFPEEIMALLFKRVKEHAEAHLHVPVTEAVIAVPSQFSSLQRESTADAAYLAGIQVLSIQNECTAAAISYGILNSHLAVQGDRNIAMISAGSGFLEVTFLAYGGRVYECKASRGFTFDVNRHMILHYAPIIEQRHGVDVYRDKRAYVCLWKACEEAKCNIKQERNCFVRVKNIVPGVDFEEKITLQDLDRMLTPITDKMRMTVTQCLQDVSWHPRNLHEYLMVGGSSQVPPIRDTFEELGFQSNSHDVVQFPRLIALLGTAMRAASLKGGQQMGLDDLLTLEVSNSNLGVISREGKCRSFVRHNDNIPHWAIKEYTTLADNQSAFYIEVYDGESKIACQNKFLAKYCVTGFPLRKRGKTHVRVTFHMDACGRLVVSAEDKSPGAEEGQVTVRKESGIILGEEFDIIQEAFNENFPPEPIPVLNQNGIDNGQQAAVVGQLGNVNGPANVQPGNVQQVGGGVGGGGALGNGMPQNGPVFHAQQPVVNGNMPVVNPMPEMIMNGGFEGWDGDGCEKFDMDGPPVID